MAATALATKVRKLTVCNKGYRKVRRGYQPLYIDLPVICLTGKWLEATGFRGGHTVDVTCEQQKLTITLSAEQRFEAL